MLSSTDGTELFISTGKISTHCKDNEILVSSVHDNKTQTYYKKLCDDDDDDENTREMHFKLAFTFTGEVQVFNPYVEVSGFTERELPSNERPSGILVVPIPAISMERNRDPTSKKNGYVVFLRNNVSDEYFHLKNHEHYHKEVYKTCMDCIRKVMHGFDNDEKL